MPSQKADEPGSESLVPPRPNLGPEPWPETSAGIAWPGWIGFSAALALLLVLVWIWKRRVRSKGRDRSAILEHSNVKELSPRLRLIAQSEQVREALLHVFGPGWRSKTTEEIMADPRLNERLDPAEFDRLVVFLKLVDRAKFADSEPEGVDEWESWTGTIADRLREPAQLTQARRVR